jgi:hypothetical protein
MEKIRKNWKKLTAAVVSMILIVIGLFVTIPIVFPPLSERVRALQYYLTETLNVTDQDGSRNWTLTGTSPYLDGFGDSSYISRADASSTSPIFSVSNASASYVPAFGLLQLVTTINYSSTSALAQLFFDYYIDNAWFSHSLEQTNGQWANTTFYLGGFGGGLEGINNFTFRLRTVSAYGELARVDYVSFVLRYNNTLINAIRANYYTNLDWTTGSSEAFGAIFGKYDYADLGTYIDNLAGNQSWDNVLRWSVRFKKYGIERANAITWALGNMTQIGSVLPNTTQKMGNDAFSVYDRDILYGCYYYGNKYGMTTKWNVTAGYNYFSSSLVNSNLTAAIWVWGNTTAYDYGSRYYDEYAETMGVYLVFYDLGITQALDSAVTVWNAINNIHWQDSLQAYGYSPLDFEYECESAFALKLIGLLRYAKSDIGNSSRIFTDAYSRYLYNNWMSHQWITTDSATTSSYAVVHANPSNAQKRLHNTFATWQTLLGIYELLNSTGQNNMFNLLNETWFRLYHDNADFYNGTTGWFKPSSGNVDATSDDTIIAMTLQFLTGMTPNGTALAFPLEEYSYEYIFDLDADLYGINVLNNSLKLGVTRSGNMRFIYGGTEVYYNFPSSGVYNITWNVPWTEIESVEKLSELPSGRKYLTSVSNPGVDGTMA